MYQGGGSVSKTPRGEFDSRAACIISTILYDTAWSIPMPKPTVPVCRDLEDRVLEMISTLQKLVKEMRQLRVERQLSLRRAGISMKKR